MCSASLLSQVSQAHTNPTVSSGTQYRQLHAHLPYVTTPNVDGCCALPAPPSSSCQALDNKVSPQPRMLHIPAALPSQPPLCSVTGWQVLLLLLLLLLTRAGHWRSVQ
jgi:hypothetical protein